MEEDHHREKGQILTIQVGGNRTTLSSWLQRVRDLSVELGSGSGVGVLEWLGCLCYWVSI